MDDLEPLLALMRRHKVLRLKTKDVELELAPDAFVEAPAEAPAPPHPDDDDAKMPTGEDLLFYSVGGVPKPAHEEA